MGGQLFAVSLAIPVGKPHRRQVPHKGAMGLSLSLRDLRHSAAHSRPVMPGIRETGGLGKARGPGLPVDFPSQLIPSNTTLCTKWPRASYPRNWGHYFFLGALFRYGMLNSAVPSRLIEHLKFRAGAGPLDPS